MRPLREDYQLADWLITNRGLAKRAVFETHRDVERFYEALAKVTAKGLIEVHAFVFMTTHFHLLLRSLIGEISLAMKLVTNEFVRDFNRTRKRDGPLFVSRFHGQRIEDVAHWYAALHYVDLNPVRAKMCTLPSDHSYGSARAYRYETGPSWLSRGRVIEVLGNALSPATYQPEFYDEFACSVDQATNAYLIERLGRGSPQTVPPLTDLIHTASLRQQGWMKWKAALADGMQVGTAFLPPHEAARTARLVARVLKRDPLPVGRAQTERDLVVGLLRTAAGRTIAEVATDLGIAHSTVHAAERRYQAWIQNSTRYSDLVARALQSAVRRSFPPLRHPLAPGRLVPR